MRYSALPLLLLGAITALSQTTPTNPVTVDQVVVLQANLNSLNENPPATTTTPATPTTPPTQGQPTTANTPWAGVATITIRFQGPTTTNTTPTTPPTTTIGTPTTNVSRATVNISIQTSLDSTQAITQGHIHRGAAGVNGPVVFDFGLGSNASALVPSNSNGFTGNGVSRVIEVTAGDQLAILREIANNPSGFYVNLHTSAFPNGVIRGQLHRASDTANDYLTNRTDLDTFLLVRIAYNLGLITLAQRDAYLATLPASFTADQQP